MKNARRKGSVMVESALIFLALATMLMGIFDFGQFLFVHQALVERARYAARWGAVNDASDTAAIKNMVLYNQGAAPLDAAVPFFNLSPSNVAVTNPDAGTNDYRINVQISGYTYTVLSPYIGGTYTGPPITVSVPLGLYN
ncbi:MAG: pilus assembly protein [Candidatus Solibacter usitatus]|nr:pilus assembly protein [Candidatus Solibacter usitatus]